MKQREKLFSVTAKDCDIQTFRAGGAGGQHQNKTETGVRVVHRASGAVGEARDSRSQHDNKLAAFRRMAATPTFKSWHRMETARRLGHAAEVERSVDAAMAPENLRVEGRVDGRWVPIEQIDPARD